jgi:UDP-N-acetylmuramate dehydrogenase
LCGFIAIIHLSARVIVLHNSTRAAFSDILVFCGNYMNMEIQENYSLKNYHTFRMDVRAKYFATFASAAELESLLALGKDLIPLVILGGGSNILFIKDFTGLVLKNEVPGMYVVAEDGEFVYIKAGAGVNWHSLVTYCVEHNYGGVENLSLIPGSVGASPMQNIGAYGAEIRDVFYQLEAFHLKDKLLQVFTSKDCEFGYRESVFKKKYKDQFAILNVTFRLRKEPVFNISYGAIKEELQKMQVNDLSIQSISKAIINIRSAKLPDPEIIGNAGSFFKNPEISIPGLLELQLSAQNIPSYKINDETVKIPAGWLIEQCGWKGYRKGDAGCYEKQALVLVNYGHAEGQEIFDLSEEILLSVKKKFGIVLEREVNII